ncbi:hypothetical protein [Marinifilum flexuosum]|uniref:hypothetical protein n=1 Tax=Marinifilum flexuosum TaxID=1117708 RepID=UPI002490B35B|nr:hypothetical protein [Marinifilum flexuosum]
MHEILAFLKTFNLIVLIITLPTAIFLIYKRKLIQKRIFIIKYGLRGQFYCEMHLLIQKANNLKVEYIPSLIIGKFLREFYDDRKEKNKKALEFWRTLYNQYPDELIGDLEKEKISLKDLDKYERLFYTMKNSNTDSQKTNKDLSTSKNNEQKSNELRKEFIKQEIINRAQTWYKKDINKQQIVRLAYYYFTLLDIIPEVEGAPRTRKWEELIGAEIGSLNYAHFAKYAFQTNKNGNPSPTAVRRANIELAHYFLSIDFNEGYDHVKKKYPDMDDPIN